VTSGARELLHSWNLYDPRFPGVRVEDDIREALQSVGVRRPTTADRLQLLEWTSRVGIDLVFLGFPAASPQEHRQCRALVQHIVDHGMDVQPVLMSRPLDSDLVPLLETQQETGRAVLADLYISISDLRLRVEGWSLPTLLMQLGAIAQTAAREGLRYRIAFEDSTRATPTNLRTSVTAALDMGPDCIVLNDTAGDCIPSGAAQHMSFVGELVTQHGAEVELAWHGHNDKGMALANALAAISGGASIISGTFLGVGERTGNTPLEQLIVLLSEGGSGRYDLKQLVPTCMQVAEALGVTIPPDAPIAGTDIFSTATGTHAAAILKARRLGGDFEDLVYSSVSATMLGRRQEILLGPNSGRMAVQAALEAASLPTDEAAITCVLQYCKSRMSIVRDVNELAAVVHAGSDARTSRLMSDEPK
jgi:isopropylmalate/homocitrate/citramalate synthase